MDTQEMKQTVPIPPVGAGGEQPISNSTTQSIAEEPVENKSPKESLAEIYRRMEEISNPDYMPTFTLNELYDLTFPFSPPVVNGLLHPGTYIFAGAPKLGKSFLMVQLAYHISMGLPLWDYHVRQGAVLYLALEDTQERLQKRVFRMFGAAGCDDLHFSICAKNIGDGLEGQMKKFLQEHTNTRLIIVDALQKVRGQCGGNVSYSGDYGDIGRLKQVADENGICLLLVHHTRKQDAGDIFDMISGTNGLMGAADGAFVFQKEKRTNDTATLDVVGRDQQDQRLYLKRDREHLLWELERVESEPWAEPPDPVLEAVATLVTADNPIWSGTATELAAAIGQDMKPNALAMRLNVRAGRLMDEYNVRYEPARTHAGRSIRLTLEQPRA